MTAFAVAACLFLLLQTPKGSIEGWVVSSVTNSSIAGGRVEATRVATSPRTTAGGAALAGVVGVMTRGVPGPIGAASGVVAEGPMEIPNATTDANGHFVFQDLAPGSYLLRAFADGYASQEVSPHPGGLSGMNAQVDLAPGAVSKDTVFRLTPGGTVSGRVTGSRGEALVNMEVTLLRTVYDPDGRKTLQQFSTTLTNDRGEYRLFWVTPGRYTISTASSNRPMPGIPFNPANVSNKYPRTFYPSTTDPATAVVVDIQPAAELSGIDLRLAEQPTFRVSGRVLDSTTGQIPPRGVSISITSRDPMLNTRIPSMGPAYNPNDGTFELRDVPSGAFLIRAQLPINARPQPGSRLPVPLSATALVDVVGSDVEGIALTFSPPVVLSGLARLDGGSGTAESLRASVSLYPAVSGPAGGPRPRPVQLNTEGTFKIDGISPGEYRVDVPEVFVAQHPNAYLKEIRFGGIDVLSQPLVISGPTSDKIEIVFAKNGGEITGIVRGNSSQMLPGMTVVLVPDKRERHDLYKFAATDPYGRFMLRGIPPGGYTIYVWEDIERNSWFDPTVMRIYEGGGIPVVIGQSSSVNLELKPIPTAR
jgi:Carboxypeptidase regulatory-like domain